VFEGHSEQNPDLEEYSFATSQCKELTEAKNFFLEPLIKKLPNQNSENS
jgi:hypothetical protein